MNREIQAMLFNKNLNINKIYSILKQFNVTPIKRVHITQRFKGYRIGPPTTDFGIQHTKFGAIIWQKPEKT